MPSCLQIVAALVVALGLVRAARAQDGPWQGSVALSSQLVDRGLAIGPRTATLQGAESWSSAGGWTIGAAAAVPLRAPGRLAEAMVQLSRSWRVSDRAQTQASLVYYDYPALGRSAGYRRVEANLSWIYRDILALNVSASRPQGRGWSRVVGAADADLRWPLAPHLALVAGLGVAQFQYRYEYHAGRLTHYGYGNAGLAWTHGPLRLEVSRIGTWHAPHQRPGTGGLAPWLATLTWSF
jgi:hypothetical protein